MYKISLDEECQLAFDNIKILLSNPPILECLT